MRLTKQTMEGKMKRLFFVVFMTVLFVCSACGSKTPIATDQTPIIQVEPKKPQTMKSPKVLPPVTKIVPLDTTPKANEPKVEPKVEPKIEAKPQVEPKVSNTPIQQGQVIIVDFWAVQKPSGNVPDLFALTFVVRNTSCKDTKIKVVCHFSDGPLFGESIPQIIKSKSEAKLMVRGFRRCSGGCNETFDCKVEPVR